jgi:DNA-binding LacI/PurR family transcriptional regulator
LAIGTKRATRVDVARAAGVSEYTVSVVLNDPEYGRVGAETRERVRRVAERLGYRPQAAGRALRLGRSELIAYVSSPELLHRVGSYHAQLVPALLNATNEAGYELAIVGDDREEALLARLRRAAQSGRFDGLIVGQPRVDDPVIDLLRRTSIPCVLTGEHPDETLYQVLRDGLAMAADVATRLRALGHQQVGLFAGEQDWARQWFNRRRHLGLTSILGKRSVMDLPVDPIAALDAARGRGLTAVVTGRDDDAAQLLAVAAKARLRVPRDLSVVSLYAVREPARTTPPVSSLCVDPSDVAREAVRLLARLIAGDSPERRRVTLPYWWAEGQTLAAAR